MTLSKNDPAKQRASIGIGLGLAMLCGVMLAGCQSIASEDLKSALLDSELESSQAQIKQIIKQELGSQDIRIADNAFIQQSSITIMKQARQTLENSNIQGRDTQSPMRFKLMKSGANCYLVLDSNSKNWKLVGVTCIYE